MLHSVTSPEQKFYSSVDLTCCVMVTDTRSTWAEGKLALISGKRGILFTIASVIKQTVCKALA